MKVKKIKSFRIHRTALILLATVLLFSACKKKPFYNISCKDKNITAAIDGKGYYSCTVQTVNSNTNCWINTNNGRSGFSGKYMVINLNFPPAVGTYTLGDINITQASGAIQIGVTGKSYSTDSLHTGTIVVTKYDDSSKKASGTFSFSCMESLTTAGATKDVTNGEFTDVKLQ